MIRAYNAIIAVVVNTITYSIDFSWLICCGELLKDARFVTGAVDDMTPQITTRCGRTPQSLIEHSGQTVKAERLSQAGHRSMSLHDRAQAMFLEG